jgi:hypothetical protein
VAPLLPVLDLIPNAAIFIKDRQARYLLPTGRWWSAAG